MILMTRSKFLIAATSSGCGKTTLSLGLMRAFAVRGMTVQPFKCGPDYIDTQFHAEATGRTSINLDTFMASENHVRTVFDRYSSRADVSIVEGVMGMLDGYERMKGSSADIARLLDIPIILLVNAASTAYSVAATIYGFTRFVPDVRVAGVIFNRVGSESHFSFLREACADAGVDCLGYIRRNDSLVTPSRHLGLTLGAREEMERYITNAAKAVSDGVDLEKLLKVTEVTDRPAENGTAIRSSRTKLRIAVARDEAFNFIYEENLRNLLTSPRYDVEVTYFSPLNDARLPEADFVYLPGGYPELYADGLEANTSMRRSVREYAESGGKMLGECGGMIYLSEEIDGKKMCGVLPLTVSMNNARLTLGYRTAEINSMVFRGHEFHYSKVADDSRAEKILSRQTNVRGREVATPVYRYKNVLAGYTHLYWAESDILKLFGL